MSEKKNDVLDDLYKQLATKAGTTANGHGDISEIPEFLLGSVAGAGACFDQFGQSTQ
jgi:hypothetical protein